MRDQIGTLGFPRRVCLEDPYKPYLGPLLGVEDSLALVTNIVKTISSGPLTTSSPGLKTKA